MTADTARIHQRTDGMTPLHLAMFVSFVLAPLLAMRAQHILTRAALFGAGIVIFILRLGLEDDSWTGGASAKPDASEHTLSPKP